MSAINIDIPIEMIVDAVLHRLDTNKRFFSKLGDVVADKLIARANATDTQDTEWFERLKNRFGYAGSAQERFDSVVSKWLNDHFTSYAKASVDRVAQERVGWAVADAKLKTVKEIRAGVIALLTERQADLTNEQLITLLNALTDKE